jgi:hypothetical protein
LATFYENNMLLFLLKYHNIPWPEDLCRQSFNHSIRAVAVAVAQCTDSVLGN